MIIHEQIEKEILSCFKNGEWLSARQVITKLRERNSPYIAFDLPWQVRGLLTHLEKRNRVIFDEETGSYGLNVSF